jgi:hypothetical protein
MVALALAMRPVPARGHGRETPNGEPMNTLRTSVISLSCLTLVSVAGCGGSSGAGGGSPSGSDAATGSASEAGSGGQVGTPNQVGDATDATLGAADDAAGATSTPEAAGPANAGDAGGATGSADTGPAGDAAGDAGRGGAPAADAGGGTGSPPDSGSGDGGVPSPLMNIFISSDTSMTGNLGGLAGADMRCQRLATAVGQGSKIWHAYLSADSPVTNARDRIGAGPYYNALGAMVAADKTTLHARNGDPAVFVDEHGARINGQWNGSTGAALQHDILTGSLRDGTLDVGFTCSSWTATTGMSFVGHSDGMGPGMSMAAMYTPWNSSHMGQCANTQPGGGAGRIYCFVGN